MVVAAAVMAAGMALATVMVMVTAAMVAAGMALAMVMVMVIAPDIGIIGQLAGQQRFHSRVCIAGNSAVELDLRGIQGHPGAGANAAADQDLCAQGVQDSGQGAMAAADDIHDPGGNDLALLDFV